MEGSARPFSAGKGMLTYNFQKGLVHKQQRPKSYVHVVGRSLWIETIVKSVINVTCIKQSPV